MADFKYTGHSWSNKPPITYNNPNDGGYQRKGETIFATVDDYEFSITALVDNEIVEIKTCETAVDTSVMNDAEFVNKRDDGYTELIDDTNPLYGTNHMLPSNRISGGDLLTTTDEYSLLTRVINLGTADATVTMLMGSGNTKSFVIPKLKQYTEIEFVTTRGSNQEVSITNNSSASIQIRDTSLIRFIK